MPRLEPPCAGLAADRSPCSRAAKPQGVIRRALMLGAVVITACSDWRDHVAPGTAPRPPEQVPLEAAPFRLAWGATLATFTPRARYRVDAVALAVDTSMRDPWSEVAALDVALGWGPMASGPILKHLRFHLRRRYVSVRWSGDFPLGTGDVMHNLSNHHLIAGSASVSEVLGRIRPGHHVILDGLLVDLEVGGQTMRTSLRRDDTGDGACEVLFVKSARIVD